MPYNNQRNYRQQRGDSPNQYQRQGGYQQRGNQQQGGYGRGSRQMKPGHIAGSLYAGNGICLWRGSIEVEKLHAMIDAAEQDSVRPGVVSARCNQSRYAGNAFLSFHGVGNFNGGEDGGQNRTHQQERYNRDRPDPRYQHGHDEYEEEELEEFNEEQEEQEDGEPEVDDRPARPTSTRQQSKPIKPTSARTSAASRTQKTAPPATKPSKATRKPSKSNKTVAWEE